MVDTHTFQWLSLAVMQTFSNGMEDDKRVCRTHIFTLALFLLLSVILLDPSHPEAKPLDFVCIPSTRKFMNKVKVLQEDLAQCSDAAFLHYKVRIPPVSVNIMIWRSRPIEEHRAEILQSLSMLAEDIHQVERNRSQAECVLTLLNRLEHNINNYIHTLTLLHTQNGSHVPQVTGSSPPPERHSLSSILQTYDRLISGKLELLVSEMMKECETKTTP